MFKDLTNPTIGEIIEELKNILLTLILFLT